MRLVNTSEAQFFRKNGRFGSLQEVLTADLTGGLQPAIQPLDDASASFGACKITLALSSDRKHYQVRLDSTVKCSQALFSHEAGLVYQGVPLGCAEGRTAAEAKGTK